MKIIGIFKGTCPTGWTNFNDWNGKFLRGQTAANEGITGGSSTHTHTIDFANRTTSGGSHYSGTDRQTHVPLWLGGIELAHSHTINPGAVTTAAASTLPTYITVVLCSKEDS
ncbi:MAG: hypothetical protein GY950_04185 [bacterium]|nr:hypothetical protein [bacterium]